MGKSERKSASTLPSPQCCVPGQWQGVDLKGAGAVVPILSAEFTSVPQQTPEGAGGSLQATVGSVKKAALSQTRGPMWHFSCSTIQNHGSNECSFSTPVKNNNNEDQKQCAFYRTGQCPFPALPCPVSQHSRQGLACEHSSGN